MWDFFYWYFGEKIYSNCPNKIILNMKKIKEKFLVIVKPGFYELRSAILKIFEENDFEVIEQKTTKFSKKIARLFYAHLREKPFFQEVIDYMTSGLVYTIVFSGDIEKARDLVGPTDPSECQDWQIRALDVKSKDKMRNIVHCSDSVESAEREIALVDNLPELWFVGHIVPLFCI